MNAVEIWAESFKKNLHVRYKLDLLLLNNREDLTDKELNIEVEKLKKKLDDDLKDVPRQAEEEASKPYYGIKK